jgi:hypothetical protein
MTHHRPPEEPCEPLVLPGGIRVRGAGAPIRGKPSGPVDAEGNLIVPREVITPRPPGTRPLPACPYGLD